MKKSLLIAVMAVFSVFLVACGDSNSEPIASNPLGNIEKNCDDNTKECFRLATRYKEGGKINKALDLFNKACDGENGNACYEAAIIYDKYDKTTDYMNLSMAYESYKKGCDLNHAESCNVLAIFQSSIGEYKAAFETYEKACEANNPHACYNMAGSFYQHGFENEKFNVQRDRKKYQALLEKACELKSSSACEDLSMGYLIGEFIIESGTYATTNKLIENLCNKACDILDDGVYSKCNSSCVSRSIYFNEKQYRQAKENYKNKYSK